MSDLAALPYDPLALFPARPASRGSAWWDVIACAGPPVERRNAAGELVGWDRPIRRIGYVLGPASRREED